MMAACNEVEDVGRGREEQHARSMQNNSWPYGQGWMCCGVWWHEAVRDVRGIGAGREHVEGGLGSVVNV